MSYSSLSHSGRRARFACWFILLPALAAGCEGPAATTGTTGGSQATPVAASARSTAAPTAGAADRLLHEVWEAQFVQGAKVGYTHTRYYYDANSTINGRPTTRIESDAQLSLQRFGQTLDQTIRERVWLDERGEMVRFEVTALLGDAPQVTTGQIIDGQAALTLQTAGKTAKTSIAWRPGTGGSTAVVDSLRRQPPTAGETRTVASFIPLVNRIAVMSLVTKSKESIEVDGSMRELVRVEARAAIDGAPPIDTVLWIDERGETWKTEYPALGQTSVRTTQARAQAVEKAVPFDLGTSSLVPAKPPLIDAHRTRQVRYLVRLKQGNVAATFPVGVSQQVHKRSDAGEAELIVTAVRPETPLPPGFTSTPPTDRERSASSVVQSDDANVQKLAAEAAVGATEPWQIAVGCEALVHRRMRSVEFSQAFATAAETARTLTGDCTEHAVLLCALLRARGLPARAAMGLVYVESRQAFGYHMWTEAWIGDRWVPLDATLGRGGISAAYLKLADTNLDGVDSYAALLPVFSVLGQLQIEVIEQR